MRRMLTVRMNGASRRLEPGVKLSIRNWIVGFVVALMSVAPACADTEMSVSVDAGIEQASLYVRSTAPSFTSPKRVRLSDMAHTATNAPVWGGQVGPLSFVDRFEDNQLDAAWRRHERGSNGWWAKNDWRADHIQVGDRQLQLVMSSSVNGDEFSVSSGELSRRDSFKYGYFESRMRAATGEGVVSGFFTFARDGSREQTWNEIDVEILGQDTSSVELTIHAEGRKSHKKIALGFDAADGFHTYGFEWSPDAVRWYIDGKMVHEVTGPIVKRLTRPQLLHLSLLGTNGLDAWAGKLDRNVSAWQMEVSCVAYASSYEGRPLCAE